MWTLIALLALLTGLAGLISILVPLRFVGITSRVRGLMVLGASFVALIVATSQISPNQASGSKTVPAPSSPPVQRAAAIANPRPADQDTFIRIAEDARNDYRSADTDFKKGAMRPARSKSLCQARANQTVSNWIGKVTGLTTNGDGKGVVEIRISDHVTMKTWNNSFSDVADETLIKPGTSVFRQLGDLRTNDRVKFSGRLFSSDVDCFKEGSATMSGSMNDPEFIIQFRNIEKL